MTDDSIPDGEDYVIVQGMPALRKAAEEDPNFRVTEEGKVTLAEGVDEATLDRGPWLNEPAEYPGNEDDSIPVGELRKLVDEWRDWANYMDENSSEYANPQLTEGAAECLIDTADELESLIEDHTDE